MSAGGLVGASLAWRLPTNVFQAFRGDQCVNHRLPSQLPQSLLHVTARRGAWASGAASEDASGGLVVPLEAVKATSTMIFLPPAASGAAWRGAWAAEAASGGASGGHVVPPGAVQPTSLMRLLPPAASRAAPFVRVQLLFVRVRASSCLKELSLSLRLPAQSCLFRCCVAGRAGHNINHAGLAALRSDCGSAHG